MSLSFGINKSGMKAQQKALSGIANNIANANTEGYKTKSVHFQSLLNNEVAAENGPFAVTAGVRSEIAGTDFSQGPLSDNPQDFQLALNGEGFFQVQDGAGNNYLTRDGSFSRDGAGQIVSSNGDYLDLNPLMPVENWPEGQLAISGNGDVFIGNEQVATVPVYLPESTQSLLPVGENKYQFTGEDLPLYEGSISQGWSEGSNVDLAQEMTNMIVAQRAYSLNLKATQSTDEMMSLINQFNQ